MRRIETEVEAGWGKLRPSPLGWTLLDDLNGGLRQVRAGNQLDFDLTMNCASYKSTARLRQAYEAEFQFDCDLHSGKVTV